MQRTKKTEGKVTTGAVEDMICAQSAASPSGKKTTGASEYSVFGDPMHAEAEEVVEQLKTLGLKAFLAHEARHSIGNYAVVVENKKQIQIITSPGYCGGYVHTKDGHTAAGTLLANVLGASKAPIEMDDFGLCFYLNHAPQSNFNQLPFTTMFKDVQRIAPGTYLEITDGAVGAFYSYLCLPEPLEPPKTFYRAMVEMTDAMTRYFARSSKKKAALMFSGGVDSLIIYLCLREALGAENVTLYTMEHSASNGPARALPVAKALGAEVTVITDDIYEDGTVYEKIHELMKQDVLTFKAPHLAFLGMDADDTIIFHGQNFDALANIHMEVLQETQEAGYYSTAGQNIAHTEDREKRQSLSFAKNLQLTDSYLKDGRYQALTVDFYAGMRKNAKPDPKPGKMGILRGMISHQYPNLLSAARYPMDQITNLNNEIKLFNGYIGEATSDPRMSFDMIRYLTYTQLANKRATTFQLGKDTRPFFMAMSGPITSYFLGLPRDLSFASQPKREIYAYSKQMSGMAYRNLIKVKGKPDPRVRKRVAISGEPLLEGKLDWLKTDGSRVLKAISEPKIANYISGIYTQTAKAVASEKGGTSFQNQIALRLLNLEKIIAEAEAQRAAAQSTTKR